MIIWGEIIVYVWIGIYMLPRDIEVITENNSTSQAGTPYLLNSAHD